MGKGPLIRSVFDEATNSVTHIVADPSTGAAAIIDPVLDFDPASGAVSTVSARKLIAEAEKEGWTICWVLETHAHADHLSAAHFIREKTGARIAIGEGILEVQKVFGPLFGAEDCEAGGGDFDRLLADGDTLELGTLDIEVIATPGHTPACVTYLVGGEAAFVGDTLFMPDYGTARADFPGGDARELYRSIKRLLALPEATRIFVCHDYPGAGESARCEATVAEHRRGNIHVRDGIAEEEFVARRTARDQTLALPALMLPAVQVNIRAGQLPVAESNGVSYLKIPVNRF